MKVNECQNQKYICALIINLQKAWKELFVEVIERDYNTPLTIAELGEP